MIDKDQPSSSARDIRPVPDPTRLTTEQLIREVASLKEVVFTRLDGMDRAIELFNDNITRVPTDTDKQIQHLKELHEAKIDALRSEVDTTREIVDARLDGMDKATGLLQDITDKLPATVDEKISSLKSLHEGKFDSIQTQFRERDTRGEQTSRDNKVAIDAALTSQKEAVAEQNKSSSSAIAKSEAATSKQMDQITQLIQSNNSATNDKFDDIKERLTRLEGRGEGKVVAETSHHSNTTVLISIVGMLLSFVAVAVTVIMAIRKG